MYELMICPIKQLYRYAEDGDLSELAVLAVSSYEIREEKLTAFADTLCLHFDDTVNADDYSAFSKDTAKMIAGYINGLSEQPDTLFVCCDSGESRSTAMAAIMRYHGMDDRKIFNNPRYHPNTLVYSLLCEALGVPMMETELQEKQQLNENALSEAIK